MDIKLIEKTKEKLIFNVKETSPAFINTIRRIMLDEVPVMAIEDVEFRKNSSVLYDEIIAHRLGLIPLKTDLKSYSLPENCKCNRAGCAKCQLKITLTAKGPGTVYSSKLKPQDPDIQPVFDNIPIVKLLENQQLQIEATAILGKGKEHAKWTPCVAYYKKAVEISTGKKCDECGKCVEVCPTGIFEMKGNKLLIIKENILRCHLCNACVEICPKNSLELNEKEDEFIFYVESFGQLPSKEIVIKATEIFDEKLDEFLEKIK